jgi:hypothetical protein
VIEIGSSQQGQLPPGPSLRAKLWHSSQYCSPMSLASHIGHW